MPALIDLERQYLLKQLGYPVNMASKSMDDLRREFYTAQGSAVTFDDMLLDNPFIVAHRGGGEERPEHTLHAYEGAIAAGAKVVEVSVGRSAEFVPICMHDATLDRTTNATGNMNVRLAADLRENVRVDIGAPLLGGAWDDQPVPSLKEVLNTIAGRAVVFIEPKDATATNVTYILEQLSRFPEGNFVWKYNRNGDGSVPQHAQRAQAAGHKLWAYLNTADNNGLIDTVAASSVDYIGVPIDMTDGQISYVVAKGKPVVAFEVNRRSERTRVVNLGVQGLMAPSPTYLARTTPYTTTSLFAAGLRAPGDIPVDYAEANSPTYNIADRSITFKSVGTDRVILLGSMCPIANAGGTYQIDYALKWPTLPSGTFWSALVFGHADDSTYRTSGPSNQPGYHLIFRANGQLQLFTHINGTGTGTGLGTPISTAAPVANTWMTFRVIVTPTNITIQRMDDGSSSSVIADTQYRGGYMHLANGTSDVVAAFRDVVVT